MEKRTRIDRLQLFSMPIMALVAGLGLAGVFGESSAETRSQIASLGEVTVTYPDRLRYRQQEKLEIEVRNTGQEVMRAIAVEIDRSYLRAFTAVEMVPQADQITSRGVRVELGDIGPGEERHLTASLEADEHGHPGGAVSVRSGEREIARLQVGTIVFP